MPTIAEGPERQRIQLLLARGLVWNQQFDEATALLVTLPEQTKTTDDKNLEEAVLAAMLGQIKPHPELTRRAVQMIERLRSEQPIEKLQLLACDVMLKLQRAEDVIQWLVAGVQPDHLSQAQRMRLANAFSDTKQFQSALGYYEQLLKEEHKSDAHDQRVESKDDAAPVSPQTTSRREELLLATARCAANAGNMERGVEHFEVLVQEFACKPEILCEFAGLLLQQGRASEALQHLPDYATLTTAQRILMIDVMIAGKKLGEAKVLADSMADDPAQGTQEDRQLLERLAVIEQVRENHRAAAEYYQRLVDLGDSPPQIRASLAQQLLFSGSLTAAVENYRWLVKEGQLPKSERYWLLLALNGSKTVPEWSWTTLGAAGRQALMDPDFPVREAEQLAYVHVLAGNKSSALGLIRIVLAKPDAEREDLLLFAANLAAEQGEFRESESFLRRLTKLRKLTTTDQPLFPRATEKRVSIR